VPSEVTVGWWFDTPEYAPFFTARVEDLRPAPSGIARTAPAPAYG
jgi:hypothetical protein